MILLCSGRYSFGFHEWIENDLVRGSQLTCFFVRAVNVLFIMWTLIDLVFVLVVETNLVLYVGRKSLDFSVSIEIEFVFVWVVEIDLI